MSVRASASERNRSRSAIGAEVDSIVDELEIVNSISYIDCMPQLTMNCFLCSSLLGKSQNLYYKSDILQYASDRTCQVLFSRKFSPWCNTKLEHLLYIGLFCVQLEPTGRSHPVTSSATSRTPPTTRTRVQKGRPNCGCSSCRDYRTVMRLLALLGLPFSGRHRRLVTSD